MTKKQIEQFNTMRNTLRKIAKGYSTPEQLLKQSKGDFGLDYEEALEMAYVNIQNEALQACKGVKHIIN